MDVAVVGAITNFELAAIVVPDCCTSTCPEKEVGSASKKAPNDRWNEDELKAP